MKKIGRTLLATAATLALTSNAQAENRAEALELPSVEVVGTTLLPGLGTPLQQVPANVQLLDTTDMHSQGGGLSGFLERNATSVNLNEAQGNPNQSDVSFRGFTASPLLGVPQGLSVFQDGVRINEPFGDIVNWDLIPKSAIANIQLIPGSNPLYGLNTLGGALAVYTKSGAQNPGHSIEVTAGSFGHKNIAFESGGQRDELDYFVTGNFSDDHGWAQHNPSRLQQLFGKVGYQDGKTDIDVSLTAADNRLEGTQTLPLSFASDPTQAYTYPDRNENKLFFLTAKGSRFLNDDLLLGANAYFRHYRNTSFASNVNGNYGQAAPGGTIDTTQAFNDLSALDQTSYGFGLQATSTRKLFGRDNQFVLGASLDQGEADFTQSNQPAAFTADRGTTPTGDFTTQTNAHTTSQFSGLFFSNTLSVTQRFATTLSGRYDRANVTIADRSGTAPKLNGDHTFSRFNPALGFTYNPSPVLTAFGGYSEGMRAPTAIELTCADPNAPCKLPNSFVSDPPLKKVVGKTVEFGLRGKLGKESGWSAAVYRTDLTDDIAFVSSGGAGTNAGYFQNIGNTRRQGAELTLRTRFDRLRVATSYAFVDATYRSGFDENSPSNSGADAAGGIQVQPGNRIPGVPRHTLKLRLDYDATPAWSVGGSMLLAGSVYARGDENNADRHGMVPGYGVFNLDTRYRVQKGWDVFARVTNLFDRTYANVGVLAQNAFNTPDHSFDGANPVAEQFRGFGAPRTVWIGTRYSWQ